jgi:hypothetical protein
MEKSSLAVSALEGVGTRMVQKGATKAMDKIPAQKRNKVRGILMIAGAITMLISGIRLLKR